MSIPNIVQSNFITTQGRPVNISLENHTKDDVSINSEGNLLLNGDHVAWINYGFNGKQSWDAKIDDTFTYYQVADLSKIVFDQERSDTIKMTVTTKAHQVALHYIHSSHLYHKTGEDNDGLIYGILYKVTTYPRMMLDLRSAVSKYCTFEEDNFHFWIIEKAVFNDHGVFLVCQSAVFGTNYQIFWAAPDQSEVQPIQVNSNKEWSTKITTTPTEDFPNSLRYSNNCGDITLCDEQATDLKKLGDDDFALLEDLRIEKIRRIKQQMDDSGVKIQNLDSCFKVSLEPHDFLSARHNQPCFKVRVNNQCLVFPAFEGIATLFETKGSLLYLRGVRNVTLSPTPCQGVLQLRATDEHNKVIEDVYVNTHDHIHSVAFNILRFMPAVVNLERAAEQISKSDIDHNAEYLFGCYNHYGTAVLVSRKEASDKGANSSTTSEVRRFSLHYATPYEAALKSIAFNHNLSSSAGSTFFPANIIASSLCRFVKVEQRENYGQKTIFINSASANYVPLDSFQQALKARL